MKALFILEDNRIMGRENADIYDKLKWYQKVYGFINQKYKNKFIRIEGYDSEDELLEVLNELKLTKEEIVVKYKFD